jgi:iron-sulfur cluster repair protein YtfE (RIC family)
MSQIPVASPSVTDTLIRDLVEQYPDTMRVLSPLGIDLCCGGGHPLGEALDLHEIDRATVIPQIEQIVTEQARQKG